MHTVIYKVRRDTARPALSFATREEAEEAARRLLEDKVVLWARVRDETGKTVLTLMRRD
jgi:hypothetical protein